MSKFIITKEAKKRIEDGSLSKFSDEEREELKKMALIIQEKLSIESDNLRSEDN